MIIAHTPIKIIHADECMDVRDGTHDSPKFVEAGIPLVTSKNLVNGKIDFSTCNFISEEDHEAISKRSKVDDGDILYAMIGTIGNPVIVSKNIEFSIKNVALFKFNNPDVYNRYIYHFLNSEIAKKQLTKLSRGGTQKFVSLGNLRKLEIPLPPPTEQSRIASILDKADELRQKRQQTIEKLDHLLQATFIDMFGDPVSNPKKWKLGVLGDLGELDRGVSKHRPRGAPELLGGIHPLIQTGDVARSQGYIRSYTSTYSDLGLAQSKKWPQGTLCITIAANIANTGILTFDACFPDSVVGFLPNQTSNTEYVQGLFLFFKQILEEKAPQSAQKNINLAILRALEVPVPPKDLQEKWSKVALSIEDQKQKLYKQLDIQNNLFNSLQNKAFSGNL